MKKKILLAIIAFVIHLLIENWH